MATERLLALLVQAGTNWISGEEISRRLGISRTAVWKQIEVLRSAGYLLQAQTRLGYRLISAPDAVTPREVLPGLATARFGRQIEYRESVGSTNDLAKQLARSGAPEGLVVLADEQVAGKGRLGRSWTTPKGSALAMSLVLRPDVPPHEAPRVTLVAAVAAAQAVRQVTGLPAEIKWPNDLQLGGRKFCGILTEMDAEVERVLFLVCGVGMNVNLDPAQLPTEFRESATSLLGEAGGPVSRAALVRAILERFEAAYDELLAGCFGPTLDRWRRLSCTLGREVYVQALSGAAGLSGIAEDVDADGALLVRDPLGKVHRVIAGEVTLRRA